jgi:predicted metal-dependent peptidase
MADMNALEKLAAGRLIVARRFPYFRAAINAMIPHAMPGLGTFGVTKRLVMYYDPAVLDKWDVEQVGAAILHEANHPMREHPARCERMQSDHQLYNIASDCEINDDFQRAMLRLPDGGVFPATFKLKDGLTAEEYYRALEQQGESGEHLSGSKGRGVGNGDCGGCAGNPKDFEEELDKQHGRSDRAIAQTRRAVADAVQKAAAHGKGDVPAGLRRWADTELAPPRIPWRQKLARVVRGACAYKSGAVDLAYDRPSRRQAAVGYGPGRPVIPAYRAPVPRVAVIVDTSGSMGSAELAEAVSETNGVLKATGANVTFVACDTRTNEPRKVRSVNDVKNRLEGGGGTDMTPAFEVLSRERERPDVIICVTDGQLYGSYPDDPPPCRAIWVVVGGYNFEPRWGEVVHTEERA